MPEWSNPSVAAFAPDDDPRILVTRAARALVADAMDRGWSGPPYDPFALAEILGFTVTPAEDIPEAQILRESDRTKILFNPNRPKTRMRFSVAHEIAHTLFPDWAEEARSRSIGVTSGDGWQLESLCNLAASELLMPLAVFSDLTEARGLQDLLANQESLGVSVEALLLRFIRLSRFPQALAILAPHDGGFRVDYSSYSHSWRGARTLLVPEASVVRACTAIGFTASDQETWDGLGTVVVEGVGLKGYPGDKLPRVAILLTEPGSRPVETIEAFSVVEGDALGPRGGGNRIIAHVVSAAPTRWGRGFGKQVATKWPAVELNVVSKLQRAEVGLGDCVVTQANAQTWFCSMVAQRRLSRAGRHGALSYSALRSCLEFLVRDATAKHASIHMPKIGSGDAAANWPLVQEMIRESLPDNDVQVTVYERPEDRDAKPNLQGLLSL